MKKSLLALAVLGAFAGTAAAQVTVYGQLEAAYGVRESTVAGVTTEDTGVQNNALGASRWGIRGSEDLGNGLKAIFNLETAVRLDGESDMMSGPRLAFVGLEGGFGRLTLGRDNNPIHSVAAASDVDGRNTFSVTGNLYEGTNRGDAITYTSPNFGGLTARAQLSNEETEVGGIDTTNRIVALAVNYANGPLTAGAGYQKIDNEIGGLNEREHWIVGAAYDLGVVKLFANAQQREIEAGASAGTEQREYNISASAPVGAFTIVAGVGRNEVEAPGVADRDGNDYMVGANYSLSKRTVAYVRHGRWDTLESNNSKGTQVGVRHHF